MATKGKTRGPKEHKYAKETSQADDKFQTKRKRESKMVGAKKK